MEITVYTDPVLLVMENGISGFYEYLPIFANLKLISVVLKSLLYAGWVLKTIRGMSSNG